MTPVEQIGRLGGAARFAELDASRYQLKQLVSLGVLVQPARGCYALPGAPPALIAATRANATLTCVSAVDLIDPTAPVRRSGVHLALPPHRGRRSRTGPHTRVHYEHVERTGRTRIATLEDAAARVAQCQPYDDAVVVLDHLTHRHGPDFLERVLRAVARARPSRALALSADVDGRARSPMETRVRLHLRRVGLAVAVAPRVPGVGEVDLLVEGVLVVELDGYEYHSDRLAYRTDRRRDRASLRLGLATVRFAFEDSDPDRVLREIIPICRVLRRAGLAPASSVPASVTEQLESQRSTWVGPGARATGWRHLTGLDAAALRRAMPALVEW